jgi:hypothetical protein
MEKYRDTWQVKEPCQLMMWLLLQACAQERSLTFRRLMSTIVDVPHH